MVRFPTLVEPCRPCDNTASAALMKGWINSIFIELSSRSCSVGYRAILAEDVLDDFIEHFRLHRLLHEMPRSPLQCRHDVLLVSDRGNHHDARFGMRLNDAFGRLDAFHLWHGDIHEHDVRMRAVELADGSQAVAGFSRHLPAERFDHAGEILTGKYGVIDDQVANRLSVFASLYRCKLLHTDLPFLVHITGRWRSPDDAGHQLFVPQSQFPARTARPVSLRPQSACRVEPMMSSPTTRIAYPRSIAALGIP